MKVMIVTIGTAGDIYPLIGVGRALRDRGHEVHLASTPSYGEPLRRMGFPFHTLTGIPGATDSPDYYHPTRSMHLVAERLLIPAIQPVYDLVSRLDPREWLLIANCHCYGARVAQERHGFYLATCVITPFHLKSVERLPKTPGLSCPAWAPSGLRRAFLGFVSRLWDRELGPSVNGFREGLGLPAVRDLWYEWSLSPDRIFGLFPKWFAPNPGDWPSQFAFGGFTVFDQGVSQEVPSSLSEVGPPLVVFAAGSAGGAAVRFFETAVAASAGQRWRAILLTGQGAAKSQNPLPDNVYRFAYVPLSELLPLTSAVVHHGGLGTISLALTAGVPQIAVPFGHDQFDNAERIERLGVGRSLTGTRDQTRRLRALIEKMISDEKITAQSRNVRQTALLDDSLTRLCTQIESDFGLRAGKSAANSQGRE